MKLNEKFNLKNRNFSVRWKIFSYLIIFISILLILLWLFQIVFLNEFYKRIKFNDIESIANTIERNIDSSNLRLQAYRLALENDTSIHIVDSSGRSIVQYDSSRQSIIGNLSREQINSYYTLASSAGGTYYKIYNDDNVSVEASWGIITMIKKSMESIVYISIAELPNGEEALIMLHSNLLPISSTVETLRVQLIYISIILLILSLLIAFLIAKRISKPIVSINEAAKELAKGNYDVSFNGSGYQEIQELNDTLSYAAKELSKVEGLRRDLIANISHDLRTPLTMITGYGEVMKDIPGENTPENIQIIIDEATRLTSLVNDLLDISRFESGNQELNLSMLNITSIIRDILLRYNKLTEREGYSFSFNYEEEVFVEGDELKLSQVIYNLINNAITYTGSDKSIVVSQEVKDGFVTIKVIDTGEGIPEEDIPLIWDRYYKVKKTHKRAQVGTGLGLSIVKKILLLHKADFGVESTVGKGSCFWFKIKIIE
ncbi:sensor histidine kinase [Alloiococcus sp. CFN-8]|uniref:sensor histidine kinase n=1 Tax=Alloiococcus sp. CFN-8 TaxID=3416081 RepID=UPI003CF26163